VSKQLVMLELRGHPKKAPQVINITFVQGLPCLKNIPDIMVLECKL